MSRRYLFNFRKPSRNSLCAQVFAVALLASIWQAMHARAQDFQNCIVEELVFNVTPERVDEFIRQDAEVWTRALATRQGFVSKHVWTSTTKPSEVRFIIRWRSRQDWKRVPAEMLEQTESSFRAAMGGNQDYKLVRVNALDQREINPDNYGLRIARLTDDNLAWRKQSEEIMVDYDHVYRKKKRYQAVQLRKVLEISFDLGQIDKEKAQLVFECSDGYQKTMPFSRALTSDGWIAVKDLEATDGKHWVDIDKKSPAPYYVVWRGLDRQTAGAYPWPYAVERLRIVEKDEFYEAAYPTHSEEAVPGYNAFRKHCLACHAINGCGGTLGVELNSPRNVTEYWKSEELRDYISDPSAYRLRSKMPSMKHLPAGEIDAILVYLSEIAGRKLTSSASTKHD